MSKTQIQRRMSMSVMMPNDVEETRQLVSGYAAVFNEETLLWKDSSDGWEFREILAPGAFDKADMSDVVLNYNHGANSSIFARTTNGTLMLSVDERGLHIEGDIIDTAAGKDVYKLIKRGDVTKMSYAFTINKASSTYDEKNKCILRTILEVGKVYDVSIVDRPAYDGTSVSARDAGEEYKQLLIARAKIQTYL